MLTEQVVVRIRPPLSKGVPRWSKENCIHALSTCSLAIAPPEESQGCVPALSKSKSKASCCGRSGARVFLPEGKGPQCWERTWAAKPKLRTQQTHSA